MEKTNMETEVEKALSVLRSGGVLLYPTDTVWGIGCNALDEKAVQRIYYIKKRDDSKSLIILMADERDIMKYVAAPDPKVFDFIAAQTKPTTVIFEGAIGLPQNLIANDGSIAIRLVKDDFCRHLIKRLRAPIVSTSANISGEPTPQAFSDISLAIKQQMDYIVQWRQQETTAAQPSQIIKWHSGGNYTVIRP